MLIKRPKKIENDISTKFSNKSDGNDIQISDTSVCLPRPSKLEKTKTKICQGIIPDPRNKKNSELLYLYCKFAKVRDSCTYQAGELALGEPQLFIKKCIGTGSFYKEHYKK